MTKVKITGQIKVVIDEINVDDGFYDIHYKYCLDGEKWHSDMYDGDFENGMSDRVWEKELKKGEAIKVVLQAVADNL